jgi:hypothetical protein
MTDFAGVKGRSAKRLLRHGALATPAQLWALRHDPRAVNTSDDSAILSNARHYGPCRGTRHGSLVG